MAVSKTPRFGLTRWTDDTDPWSRDDFDDDNAAVEALGAIARRGLYAARGASSATSAGQFFYATDRDELYYDTGSVGSGGDGWVTVARRATYGVLTAPHPEWEFVSGSILRKLDTVTVNLTLKPIGPGTTTVADPALIGVATDAANHLPSITSSCLVQQIDALDRLVGTYRAEINSGTGIVLKAPAGLPANRFVIYGVFPIGTTP